MDAKLKWPFAAAWAALTGTAWLAVWMANWTGHAWTSGQQSPLLISAHWSESTLCLCALFAQIVSVAVRWPFIGPNWLASLSRYALPREQELPHRQAGAQLHGEQPNWLVKSLVWLAGGSTAVSLSTDQPRAPVPELTGQSGLRAWWAATAPVDHELCWLATWTANLYQLGIVWALCTWPASTILMLSTALIIEGVLFPVMPQGWLRALGLNFGHQLPARLTEQLPGEDPMANDATENADAEDDKSILRSATHGLNESGTPYINGWVRHTLGAQQKQSWVTISFAPPFTNPPEVDLDVELLDEDEGPAVGEELVDVQATVEHLTAAGMRVALKRERGAIDANRQVDLKLHWHASHSQQEENWLLKRLP